MTFHPSRWYSLLRASGLCALSVACVRDVPLGVTDGGHNDGDSDGRTFARDAAPDIEPLSAECPAEVPPSGTSCSVVTLRCEYGSDPVPACNTIAYCELEPLRFTLTSPAAGCPLAPPTNGPECPTSYAKVTEGGSCSAGQACHYAEGECDCGFSQPISSGWTCMKQTAGCPETPPRFGAACPEGFPDEGQCYYYACSLNGAYAFCDHGVWNGGPGGCAALSPGLTDAGGH
jgi:hypothetical protein